jgi:iron(III) transport system ATP-binding protein
VEGELVQRTFLGETWDYVVSPAGGTMRLKVTALPFQVFEVGQKLWLELDPRQMSPVAA